jgi:hypothetical protein
VAACLQTRRDLLRRAGGPIERRVEAGNLRCIVYRGDTHQHSNTQPGKARTKEEFTTKNAKNTKFFKSSLRSLRTLWLISMPFVQELNS